MNRHYRQESQAAPLPRQLSLAIALIRCGCSLLLGRLKLLRLSYFRCCDCGREDDSCPAKKATFREPDFSRLGRYRDRTRQLSRTRLATHTVVAGSLSLQCNSGLQSSSSHSCVLQIACGGLTLCGRLKPVLRMIPSWLPLRPEQSKRFRNRVCVDRGLSQADKHIFVI